MNRPCAINGTDNQTGPFMNESCKSATFPYPGNAPQEIMRITSIVCYVVIFVMSCLGNSSIIAIVLRNKSMQSKANVLIINMAVSDLLATLLALPRMLDVAITSSFEWKVPSVIAEGACKLGPFMREASCAVSIFSMVAIALDRFFAIVLPLHRKPRVLQLMFLIPGIWLTALASNALYLYAFQLKINPNIGLVCGNVLTKEQEKIFDTFRFVVFIAVPLLLLDNLYTAIAFKMGRREIPGVNVHAFASNRRQQNRKIIKLAIAILVFFVLSWTPYYILLLMFVYGVWSPSQSPSQRLVNTLFVLQDVFTILTYVSFAINPVICIAFSSNFRRHASRTFCISRFPATLTFRTKRTTFSAATTNQTTTRRLSLSHLDISLRQVTGIENQGQKDDET